MKKQDIILAIVLLLAAGVFLIPSFTKKETGDAYIYTGGELYGIYDLSVATDIHIVNDNGIVNDIEISNGTVRMKNATCPGKQCMAAGYISRNNESICCAPAGLIIVIRSSREDGYDAVTK